MLLVKGNNKFLNYKKQLMNSKNKIKDYVIRTLNYSQRFRKREVCKKKKFMNKNQKKYKNYNRYLFNMIKNFKKISNKQIKK